MRTVDLNADLGEGMPNDAALLGVVSSANVACGGHAGDRETMRQTLILARENAVMVGAHPGWPDPEHFGRQRLQLPLPALLATLQEQIGTLRMIADEVGWPVQYVKLHGALANQVAEDLDLAWEIATLLQQMQLGWLVMAQTAMQRAAEQAAIRHFAEAFADRSYAKSGLLTPREQPGAVLHAPDGIATRALAMLERQALPLADGAWLPARFDSLCVHGETPEALAIAQTVRARLHAAGWLVQAPRW